jgi:hypothetical protein
MALLLGTSGAAHDNHVEYAVLFASAVPLQQLTYLCCVVCMLAACRSGCQSDVCCVCGCPGCVVAAGIIAALPSCYVYLLSIEIMTLVPMCGLAAASLLGAARLAPH